MQKVNLVSNICSATEEVFSMMLDLPITVGEAYVEVNHDESFNGVESLIGLAGAWVGAGRLSCSTALACRLSGALLCAKYEYVNEDVLDAMAEVTNMIIGSVKTRIEDDFGPMGLSIPTVIFGRNYKARSTGGGDWTVVPFFCDGDRLDVKICLAPGNANSHQGPRAQPSAQHVL